jgi:hypothetical protein
MSLAGTAVVATAAIVAAPAIETADEGWAYLLDGQPTAAHAAFEKRPPAEPRERRLAQVVLAMSRPDLSQSDVPGIAARLHALSEGNDSIAPLALYLEARLYQIHSRPADYVRASRLYRELAQRWPGSHWAQLGLVKLGLAMLYALPTPTQPAERLAGATALLPELVEPNLRRDLELQIGRAALAMRRPLAEVLPHLLAADRVGGLLGNVPADLVAQIGELSARDGRIGQARAYFERFLRDFPSDPRCYNVRQRLREIGAQQTQPGSGT